MSNAFFVALLQICTRYAVWKELEINVRNIEKIRC